MEWYVPTPHTRVKSRRKRPQDDFPSGTYFVMPLAYEPPDLRSSFLSGGEEDWEGLQLSTNDDI